MKKSHLSLFIAAALLSACHVNELSPEMPKAENITLPKEAVSENIKDKSASEESALASEAIRATGEFAYYPSEGPAGFKGTAQKKVCFTPAELETINEGEMLCFKNTEEALGLLSIPADQSCSSHWWGVATVEIQNLSNNGFSTSRSNPCFEEGSCLYNEAELVGLTKMMAKANCKQ